MKPLSKKEQLKYINQNKKEKKKLEKECHELWRDICFLRADYTCEYPNCYNKATQPHHIKTKGAYPHLKYDINNSMALCYPHHKGGKYGAHNDINFKDRIINANIRTQDFFNVLNGKAGGRYKIDLKLEKLYLEKEYEILVQKKQNTNQGW